MDDLLADNIVIEAGLALGIEGNRTFLESKEGIVLANTDVRTWEDIGTALAHDNLAYGDLLTVVYLDSEVFRIGVSSVFC